ncbi:MAG: GNAT family N-acetyltransferase [Candidatus Marinimicrobia bacterium]|nr:GNAT family N-acetyltransferase [Candidatus Neomarinimicrobiota bacterium]
MELSRFRPFEEKIWDFFVPKTNNGTLFHLRSFLNYHPNSRFNDHSILVRKKGKLFSLFPAVEQIIDGKKILFSHPGATVGSFSLPENLSIADALCLGEQLIKYAKGKKFQSIKINLPPNLYQRRLSNYMEYSFFKHGFKYSKREITSILFLEKTIEKTKKKFRPSHLRAVRKAIEKNIIVKESKDIEAFYTILKNNLEIRHGVSPTHTLGELKQLFNLFPKKIKLFSAFLDEQMIAGVVTFQINQRVLLAFYISHDERFSELRAVNLLFYHIFEWAIKFKFQIFDFGIFTINGEPNMGLGRFKENFGASGIFRDTIELNLDY